MQELRNNLPQIVEEAAIAKKEFTVTKFGKPKAKIVPLQPTGVGKKQKYNLRESPLFGMWKDREDMADSAEWVRKLRAEEDHHRTGF